MIVGEMKYEWEVTTANYAMHLPQVWVYLVSTIGSKTEKMSEVCFVWLEQAQRTIVYITTVRSRTTSHTHTRSNTAFTTSLEAWMNGPGQVQCSICFFRWWPRSSHPSRCPRCGSKKWEGNQAISFDHGGRSSGCWTAHRYTDPTTPNTRDPVAALDHVLDTRIRIGRNRRMAAKTCMEGMTGLQCGSSQSGSS